MGIKGVSSNRRRAFKSRKSTKWQRTLKAEKKKQLPAECVNIENLHLFSKEKLKCKLRCPTNNIKISGKKLRRLTKRLGHTLKEKSQMDIEVTNTRSRPRKVNGDNDADMTEVTAETKVVPADTSSSALLPPASSKKTKKRRGRKQKKKDSTLGENIEGKIFETDDGWEDVDMGESVTE